jgi:hypothetical protein
MAARLSFSTYDRLNKSTSMSMLAPDAVTTIQVQAIADAVDAIIRGTALRAVTSLETVVDAGAAGPSTDSEANRGSKWLFRIQDSVTGVIYTHELGTADGTVLPSPDSDFVNLGAGLGLAVKTAIDAVYRSPDDNAGVLLSVQQVNRALN